MLLIHQIRRRDIKWGSLVPGGYGLKQKSKAMEKTMQLIQVGMNQVQFQYQNHKTFKIWITVMPDHTDFSMF